MVFSGIPAATCRVRWSEYLPFPTLYTKCGQTEVGSEGNNFSDPWSLFERGFLTCHELFIILRWRGNEWHWLSSFTKTVTLSSLSLLIKLKTPFPHREVIQALPETPRKISLKLWIGFILFFGKSKPLVRAFSWWSFRSCGYTLLAHCHLALPQAQPEHSSFQLVVFWWTDEVLRHS